MPGFPRIDKGEGLVRTHDLLATLQADIDSAYEVLEANKASQYLRRCVVRAIFSYIEAAVECIKVETRAAIRHGRYTAPLSKKEQETLVSTFLIGGPKGKFLPLEQNIKRSFRLAAKVWGLDFRLALNGQDYADFLAAKDARNKLTHPRTFYDIEVTDRDMSCHTAGMLWVRREFGRLFQTRIDSLTCGLPKEIQTRLHASHPFAAPEAPEWRKPANDGQASDGNPAG